MPFEKIQSGDETIVPRSKELVDAETIEELIEKLPSEHEDKWRRVIAGRRIEDQITILQEGIKKRAESLKGRPYQSENLRIIQEVPHELLERMQDIEAYSEEIDRGSNGRIIRCLTQDPARPAVVYKVLLHPPIAPQNLLLAEAGYQADLHALSMKHPELRVRVPKPYFFVSRLGIDAMAQEEVTSCVSVKNIIDQDIPIPETLDIDRIFHFLAKFIERMHEAGFYHRDLREGNVMVSLDPSLPEEEPLAFIIDMGYCTQAWSEEGAYRNLDSPRDNVILHKVREMLKRRQQIQRDRV
ncbi:hypothetical protein A2765_04855 [Candidatus Kaiserbacteria bacterium RIFCSPHIGHO2_01_FULL_56_24]|uniref:Protein kinase domain-containing protein n=1 Tax=Candidatus Kaiserbacteria bacterium RIFCSPHIGHO2_01_FULL_56_24 TaxID=1798487 RepID=A0A1F6DER3_9BACT|nr:MAG: hypothetical protein A2765_04855 [Candidatus Kaiserbacteria bacterium RIFCSPHIGHO2_01_FULL_56_24]